MFRLSKLLEKLEDKSEARFKSWLARNKSKLPMRVPAVIVGWYFYGMFLNSLRLGIASTFHSGEDEIKSIWVLNPFKNWGAVFTGFGIVTTLVIVLIICLITKKGYIWFSGYKYTHDPRGFDILPDGTHGTSGFLTEKEMREFLELSPAGRTAGMILGKVKKHPDDPDAYALYAAHRMVAGDNNNLLCIGAPGSGKSRGFIQTGHNHAGRSPMTLTLGSLFDGIGVFPLAASRHGITPIWASEIVPDATGKPPLGFKWSKTSQIVRISSSV